MNKDYLGVSFVYGTIGSMLLLVVVAAEIAVSEATRSALDVFGGSLQSMGIILTTTQEMLAAAGTVAILVGNGMVRVRPLISFLMVVIGGVLLATTVNMVYTALPLTIMAVATVFTFLGAGSGMAQILGSVAKSAAVAARSTGRAVKNADDSLQR